MCRGPTLHVDDVQQETGRAAPSASAKRLCAVVCICTTRQAAFVNVFSSNRVPTKNSQDFFAALCLCSVVNWKQSALLFEVRKMTEKTGSYTHTQNRRGEKKSLCEIYVRTTLSCKSVHTPCSFRHFVMLQPQALINFTQSREHIDTKACIIVAVIFQNIKLNNTLFIFNSTPWECSSS